MDENARKTVEKDTEERFEGQEINNDNVVKMEKKVEDGFAEVDEDVYTENKEMLAMKKEMYAKDEDLYAKESEEMYAKNEEIYAKSKESCFCWPPGGPSQSKTKQMSKEKIGILGSKHHLNNSLHKAGGGSVAGTGTTCWSDSGSVWGSDFPGTIRSSLGEGNFEVLDLVAIHAYQGGEPGTITLKSRGATEAVG